MLGTERAGLTNAQIGLCHRICHIPANPEYSSLNVAQALQLAAWELRYALLVDQGAALLPVSTAQAPSRGAEPASGEAVQAFLAHWEEALIGVQFLDPAHPKKLMPRLNQLFNRAQPSPEEIHILRGMAKFLLLWERQAQAEGKAAVFDHDFLNEHTTHVLDYLGQIDDTSWEEIVAQSGLPLVECDGVLIERVLCNLLENAAKYTPPGSALRSTAPW